MSTNLELGELEYDGVIIITGGSRGIGAATALRLAAPGRRLVISYVNNAEAAAAVVEEATAAGAEVQAVQADVARETDVLRIFAAADDMGPLGGLVNNAGILFTGNRVDEFDAERIQRTMAVNVTGSFLCAREAVRRMSTTHGGTGGSIVNLSSRAASFGSPNEFVDYAASKGAVDTMTIGLAAEVAREQIRVNAVRPGLIFTEIHASSGAPDRVEQLQDRVPMGRGGTADEVAATITWLLSTQASYVTGALLDVGGGR